MDKKQAKRDFGLDLTCKEDLIYLDKLTKKSHYLDKTDWLRELMRTELKR